MKCPHCGHEINVGQLLGSVTSRRKARSSKANGRLGGRPRKERDANTIAHGVVAEAERRAQ